MRPPFPHFKKYLDKGLAGRTQYYLLFAFIVVFVNKRSLVILHWQFLIGHHSSSAAVLECGLAHVFFLSCLSSQLSSSKVYGIFFLTSSKLCYLSLIFHILSTLLKQTYFSENVDVSQNNTFLYQLHDHICKENCIPLNK